MSFTIRFPFDWKLPIGYLVASFEQILVSLCHDYTGLFVIMAYIGFCKLCDTFTIDINESLKMISNDVKSSKTDKHSKWIKELTEIVQLHGDSEQLGSQFNSAIF